MPGPRRRWRRRGWGRRPRCLTSNLDTIAQMSCNPAIGGVAKGQIVREIDALGGAMGRAIDATAIQFRMLNRSKGPAMHGPRAQADKRAYQQEIKRIVESQPGLSLRQETVEDLIVEAVRREQLRSRRRATCWAMRCIGPGRSSSAPARSCKACCTWAKPPCPADAWASRRTPASAERWRGWDFELAASRPARRRGSTAARSTTRRPRSSGATTSPSRSPSSPSGSSAEQIPCWITYTNEAVHELIRANLHRRRCSAGRFNRPGRATALRSKPRSSALPTSRGTSCFSSRKGGRRTRSTSTDCRPACRATCKTRCCG